jgi:hypothetical protein
LLLGIFLALPACVTRLGGSVPQDKVIASLRSEGDALRSQVASQQLRIKELEALLASTAREGERVRTLGTGVEPFASSPLAELPAVTSIELDRFSGADRAGTNIIFYVKLLDSREKFTQGVGTLLVEVFAGDKASTLSETPVSPLASLTLGESEFRDALQSGFAGTFYRVELPLSLPAGSFTLRATFADSITGGTHVATLVKPFRHQPLAKRTPPAGE